MINLCYCANDGAYKGVTMSLLSASNTTAEALHVYVLTGDFTSVNPKFKPFSEKQRALLEKEIQKKNPNSSIVVLDIAPLLKKELANSPNMESSYTPYTFLRLLLGEVPGMPDKILYLDADTIVMKDLLVLYSVDLGDKVLGGVRDAYGRFWINPNYCNAGVLLMNLPALKEGKIFERCFDLLRKKHYSFPDQDVLNIACRGKKFFLPREFNEQKKLRESTLIRHYCNQPRIFPYVHAMVAKPWDLNRIHAVYKITSHDRLYSQCESLWREFENE